MFIIYLVYNVIGRYDMPCKLPQVIANSHHGWLCEWVHSLPVPTWWRHQMETFSALLALCAGIQRSPVISLTKTSDAELWCPLLWAWINGRANNREAGDLWCHRAHYDVTVMGWQGYSSSNWHTLPRTTVDKSKRVVPMERLGNGAEIVVVGNGAEIVIGGLGKAMQFCHSAK